MTEPGLEVRSVQRVVSVIGLPAQDARIYEELHRAVWPEVLARLRASNVTNYSIHRHEETLFAYFEYVGQDFDADMALIEQDPVTQRWWAICMPLQRPMIDRKEGDWWMRIPELFHMD